MIAAPRAWGWAGFWLVTGMAAVWFLAEALAFVADRDAPAGETLLNRRLWYYSHVALAVPLLLIAPIQFIAALRVRRPAVHRWLGRAYLTASLVAGLMALHLGLTITTPGTQVPLSLFAVVWIGFSIVAWQAARRRRFDVHRAFVIRGTALALSFVWVRMMAAGDGVLLGFIESDEMRAATRGWLSFVLPLLVTETWLNWWPAAKRIFART